VTRTAVKLSPLEPQWREKSRHLPDPYWDLEDTGQLPGPNIGVMENRVDSSLKPVGTPSDANFQLEAAKLSKKHSAHDRDQSAKVVALIS
jgi:hypothetical protein